MKKKAPVPRNGHAHADIMRKGGRHEKTYKALRRKEKMKNRISRQDDAVFSFSAWMCLVAPYGQREFL